MQQFHDAHPSYNKQIKKALYKLIERMGDPEIECPVCGEEFNSTRPQYSFVSRLDFISRSYKRVLENIDLNLIKNLNMFKMELKHQVELNHISIKRK